MSRQEEQDIRKKLAGFEYAESCGSLV